MLSASELQEAQLWEQVFISVPRDERRPTMHREVGECMTSGGPLRKRYPTVRKVATFESFPPKGEQGVVAVVMLSAEKPVPLEAIDDLTAVLRSVAGVEPTVSRSWFGGREDAPEAS